MLTENFSVLLEDLKAIGHTKEAAALHNIFEKLAAYAPSWSTRNPLLPKASPQSPQDVNPTFTSMPGKTEELFNPSAVDQVVLKFNTEQLKYEQEALARAEKHLKTVQELGEKDPAVLRQLQEVINRRRNTVKALQSGAVSSGYDKLAASVEVLESKGYTAMAQRLSKVARALIASVHVDEHHSPSIETVFESSKEEKEVSEHLEKLAKLHDDIAKHVREFIKDYKAKMHTLSKKEKDEDTSSKIIVSHVTNMDSKIDSIIKDFKLKLKKHPINK